MNIDVRKAQQLNALLRAESVGKQYGERRVLVAATLHVFAGRITGLFGRNGCGKSTLMKIMAGQIRGDHGFIHFDGSDYHSRPPLHVLARAGLYYAPTEGAMSRWLEFGQQLQAVSQFSGNTNRMQNAIALFHLDALLDRKPKAFSGGESRRAALALAYARNPRCLLADEPLYGIDPNDREVLLAAFRQMADQGCALLITGHEATDLLPVCDDVAWMSGGSISMLGNGEAARAHHSFRRDYLG